MSLRSDFRINCATPEVPERKEEHQRAEFPRAPAAFVAPKAAVPEAMAPEAAGAEGMAPPVPSPITPSRTGPRRVAFLVTHGMGQQVPFATLSAIGQALITEHSKRHPEQAPEECKVNVRRVRLTSANDLPELSRAEITLPPKDGKSVEAHIYESYWAPLTEGQISFVQTAAFLYSAAWNGLTTYFLAAWRRKMDRESESPEQESLHQLDDGHRHFDRWMFGQFHDMAIKSHTFGMLIAAVAAITALLIPAAMMFTPAGWAWTKKLLTAYQTHFLHLPHWIQAGLILLAAAFLAVAALVRYFIVEYVGDVAIYVSSYKVSRFDAIRNQILATATRVAREIYSAGIADGVHPRYDNIIIVGHSLGSVISYDLLNAAINWDQVECDFERAVVPRTARLITFGSPLDKTAFLFRTQVSDARNLREALAARMQPLIVDYEKFRPLESFRWINIYSKWDVISGHLDYYDVLDLPGCNPVDNRIDPEATTPLMAHTQYWDNAALHQALYEAAWAW